MPKNGINRLLSAARSYESNRKYLDSADSFSRYFAEQRRDEFLDAASTAPLAAKQHEMLRGGLCSLYNRLRDVDAYGRGHHFQTLEDVERALLNLLERYEESCNP